MATAWCWPLISINTEEENKYSCTSASPYAFMTWTGRTFLYHDINYWDYVALVIDKWMNKWIWMICGMMLTRENWSALRKMCPSATLSTTNPKWADLGLNLGLCSHRQVPNHLKHSRVRDRVNELSFDHRLTETQKILNKFAELRRQTLQNLFQGDWRARVMVLDMQEFSLTTWWTRGNQHKKRHPIWGIFTFLLGAY